MTSLIVPLYRHEPWAARSSISATPITPFFTPFIDWTVYRQWVEASTRWGNAFDPEWVAQKMKAPIIVAPDWPGFWVCFRFCPYLPTSSRYHRKDQCKWPWGSGPKWGVFRPPGTCWPPEEHTGSPLGNLPLLKIETGSENRTCEFGLQKLVPTYDLHC